MATKNNKSMTVAVDEETHKWVADYAEVHDLTNSQVVRRALRQYIRSESGADRIEGRKQKQVDAIGAEAQAIGEEY